MTISTIQEAYERAAGFTPTHFGNRLTGSLVNGYWIDARRYFFCASECDAAGRIGTPPFIADAVTGLVEPLVAVDRLASLISEHSGKQVEAGDLIAAQYDMPDPATLVVQLGLDIYHVALEGPKIVKAETLDPTPALHSPDGHYAAFLKDNAVWLKNRTNGTARQISPDGERYHAYGAFPESATLPLAARKFSMPEGLWSADSEWFATCRIDERHLPDSGLTEHVPANGGRAVAHVFKVTSHEAELPTAEFALFHIPTSRSIIVSDRKVAVMVMSAFKFRQCWFGGNSFYFLDWERFSAEVALVELNLSTGETRTVLQEKADAGWLEVHPAVGAQAIVRTLAVSGELIWYSEADGHGHLYLNDMATGTLKNRITRGAWTVRELLHVDEDRRRILFLASGFSGDVDPGYRRLCTIGFDGSGFEILPLDDGDGDGDVAAQPDPVTGADQTKAFRPGYARGGVSPDGRHIVVQIGSVNTATRTLLAEVAAEKRFELARSNADRLWTAPKPQPFEVLAADGITKLYGALYFPTGFDPSQSYPLLDYIYPGPQVNWFVRRLATQMTVTLQSVVELGMVGIILETRGMPGRNRAFHQAGGGQLHEPQLSDHVAAIKQLCRRHSFLDRERIGIFGSSGGGFATARAMFDYPEFFKVGVSVAANSDSRNYISHWIDKYGGRPGTAEREEQSNLAAAHKLQGKLLLIHGDMDDNVLLAHMLAVSAALIEAGKDFDHLIVPNAGHGVVPDNPYALQRLWNHFVRYQLNAEPPADFPLRWTRAEYGRAMTLLTDRPGS
jgi:dipeptidyl-peptidase-4